MTIAGNIGSCSLLVRQNINDEAVVNEGRVKGEEGIKWIIYISSERLFQMMQRK